MTTAAQAAQNTELSPATDYRDLLNPIPNALTVLKSNDERLARSRANETLSEDRSPRVKLKPSPALATENLKGKAKVNT